MSFNSRLVKSGQSTIVALTGVTATSTAGGPTLAMAAANMEPGSLVANVSCDLTTSTTTVITRWQVSNNGTDWVDLKPINDAAIVGVPSAGTGSLVTTTWAQACQTNVPYPYVRLAILVGVATAGAGDNVTISYNYIKRGE